MTRDFHRLSRDQGFQYMCQRSIEQQPIGISVEVMASAVRSLCRLASGVSTVALRRRGVAALPARWRYFTAASFPAWKVSAVHQAKLHLLAVVPRRSYAEGITSQELTDRVVQVLKLFDKIDPSKVHKFIALVNIGTN